MYILLTGSTGVGKSSVMEQIYLQAKTVKLFSDPYIDNPFLADAYTAKRMVCQSQMFFMKEFLKIHKNINILYNNCDIIQERSIYECIYIFCRLFYKQGKIDNNEFDLLRDFLNILQPELQLPDIVAYLTAAPLNIKKRIEKRNRNFEATIDISFIELQQLFYVEWLNTLQLKYNIPILTVDNSDLSIEQTKELIIKVLNERR